MSSYTWVKITPTIATQHKLYGVGGWLLLLAIILPMGLIKDISALSEEAIRSGVGIVHIINYHPSPIYVKFSLWLDCNILAVLYWALLTKQPHFRIISAITIILWFPVKAAVGLINPFEGIGGALGKATISWVFSSAVWLGYLYKSRRVRVTFDHKIRSDEIVITSKDMSHVVTTLDDEFWAKALAEYDRGPRRAGLYARAFSEAQGDEAVTKANYLKYRAKEFSEERKKM